MPQGPVVPKLMDWLEATDHKLPDMGHTDFFRASAEHGTERPYPDKEPPNRKHCLKQTGISSQIVKIKISPSLVGHGPRAAGM